jgi:predicted Zn-dependent protease
MRRIDGLVYGDNPDQGVVRGSRFLHRKLRFEMTFPAGWDVNNMPTQVAARKPDADVFVLLQIVDNPQGRSIEDAALAAMGSAGFRALEGARTQINGLDAFVATYDGTLEGLGRARVRAAHLLHDRTVFMIAGLASAQLYDSAERDFSASIRSFRPLTAAEAEQIRPNRIDLYTAREGDTWQSIAERQGKGVVKATTLAIMNGREPSEQPRAGERLKIVVGG